MYSLSDIEKIGNSLRESREYLGFSIDEVALKFRCNPNKIQKLENGENLFTEAALVQFASFYGFTIPEAISGRKEINIPVFLARSKSEVSEKDIFEVSQFANFLSSVDATK